MASLIVDSNVGQTLSHGFILNQKSCFDSDNEE